MNEPITPWDDKGASESGAQFNILSEGQPLLQHSVLIAALGHWDGF